MFTGNFPEEMLTADESTNVKPPPMDTKNVPGEEKGMKDIFCLEGRCMTLKLKRIQQNFIEEPMAGESQLENPLLNSLILHQVLSYMNKLRDLKNCRLVHSTWTAEATNFLKTKSIIKISNTFLDTLTSEEEVLQELEVFQPQNLRLLPVPHGYSNKTWGIVKEQIKKLSGGVKRLDFPTNVKEQINRLNMHYLHPLKPMVAQRFTEILEYNFPNLVQLVFGELDFSWPSPPPPPIYSVKRIDWIADFKPPEHERPKKLKLMKVVFRLAPNLEALKLKKPETEWQRRQLPQCTNLIFDHFNNHPNACPKLEILDLNDLSPLDIDALFNLKIKLRCLKLSQLPLMANYQKFQDFLEGQNGTLERLRLVLPPSETTRFDFPCLPKLKKLKLVHYLYSIKIGKVDYAKQFPVLQTLVIKYKDGYSRLRPADRIWLICPTYGAFLPVYSKAKELSKKHVCRTLRVLKLPYPACINKPKTDELFGIRERLSITFPNVHNKDLNIGRSRVAEGRPFMSTGSTPVGRRTRSKATSHASWKWKIIK